MTKRLYEAAKDYGVSAKDLIQTLSKHQIKAGNFTGIDDTMKKILDNSFKGEKKDAAPRSGNSGNRSQGNRSQHNTKKRNTNPKQQDTTTQQQGRPQQQNTNGQQTNEQRQNNTRGQNRQGSNQQNRTQDNTRRTNTSQGNRSNRSQSGTNQAKTAQHNGQNTRSAQGNTQTERQHDGKRTKFFGRSQNGEDSRNQNNGNRKNKHTQNRDGNKNAGNGKNRPHTLLSNVLNKGKKKGKNGKNMPVQPVAEPKKKNYPTEIEIPESITVKDFAERLGRDVGEVIKKLLLGGIMATINQEIDYETASLIADEFGVTVSQEAPPEDPTEIEEIIDPPETLKTRPPVVTVMGHVDHGKTSLLDAIRQTNVTSHEAGGITQHIGAYQVRYEGKKIVFMDTPGHEAFTAMRARGAQVTDIAVLVVAADDGVMPQTIESINHAKSAGVPIIVAINKIDKESANPEHVMQQLTEYGLVSEDWGGDTIMVPVSAHKKIGLDDLLENILVLAEVLDLKANPNRPAEGVVIEAKLDKGRGPVASVLIQKGTLQVGDTIIVGTCFGKVRAMNSERGERVKKAGPSIPVEILGLNDVPEAGDILNVTDEKTARSVAEKRLEKKRSSELHVNAKVTLDDLFNQIHEGELKELPLIVKGDVQGSVEALSQSLQAIKSDEVRISIVHAGVGAITESDIMLASASNALVIGFNVRPDAAARKAAEHENVDMRMYRVIYDAINDVEAAIKGMLEKKYEEKVIGRAEVRQVFTISTQKVVVAGAYVKEGKIKNNSKVRLIRNGIVVYEGEVAGLRRFKDEVKEVVQSFECGVTLDKFRDIKEGDEIEAYEMVEVAPE